METISRLLITITVRIMGFCAISFTLFLLSHLPLLHELGLRQCHVLRGEDAEFALALHRALTPLPSTACDTRTKRANSLSNTNNPEQTSRACSFFCGKGSAESDPVCSHSSLGHVTLLGLALLAVRASASPLGLRSLESRILAHTACNRHR